MHRLIVSTATPLELYPGPVRMMLASGVEDENGDVTEVLLTVRDTPDSETLRKMPLKRGDIIQVLPENFAHPYMLVGAIRKAIGKIHTEAELDGLHSTDKRVLKMLEADQTKDKNTKNAEQDANT